MVNGAKIGQVVLFALLLIFWVIWLAGIGATEDVCVDQTINDQPVRDCGMNLSLTWWVLFLELIAITMGIVLAFVPSMAARFDGTAIIFFTIATTLMCYTAYQAVLNAYDYRDEGEATTRNGRSYQAMAAGNVGLLVLNFIYLILITDRESPIRKGSGMGPQPSPSYNQQPKQVPEPVYGTTTPGQEGQVARV